MNSNNKKTIFSNNPDKEPSSEKYVPFVDATSPTNLNADIFFDNNCPLEEENDSYQRIFERKTGFKDFYSEYRATCI